MGDCCKKMNELLMLNLYEHYVLLAFSASEIAYTSLEQCI